MIQKPKSEAIDNTKQQMTQPKRSLQMKDHAEFASLCHAIPHQQTEMDQDIAGYHGIL